LTPHILKRLAFALGLASVLAGISCDLQLHDGYRVLLENMGRDPIHVGGTRCPQNQSTVIGYVGGEYEDRVTLGLKREDIDLGTLTLDENRQATAKNDVVVTMDEPVYFDFVFTSNDTSRVTVTYSRP
jgi:hypothetical protein